jgi:alpha-amylase
MRKLFLLFAAPIVLLTACNNGTQVKSATGVDSAGTSANETIDGHSSWIAQGNIYEVNIRQYTPEGTFRAFAPHLQRLKDMGVQTLWFMPIQPISKKDRKGPMGSYYAIANYTAINPEFGTMEDWNALVKQAHDMGFKVIIDWVANHTGADHPWLTAHKDFYELDSATGQAKSPFDWTDVRKLNYKNPAVGDSMLAAMQFWVNESNIDGFRCDVAAEVPKEFWVKAIGELRKKKNLFMLAEADKGWLHEAGFDATYAWPQFHKMKEIAAGRRPAFALDSVNAMVDTSFPKKAMLMYFTSNHDENSWNKADWGTMPGASHAPFAVLTQTIARSVPLIYSGQEEPFLDSIRFFYKDTITFGKFERANFYKTLLNLRKNNEALAADASFKKLATSNDAAMYCFEREKGGKKVLVVLNLSATPQEFTWKTAPSQKEWNNVFNGVKEPVDKGFGIEPWGYAIYTDNPQTP